MLVVPSPPARPQWIRLSSMSQIDIRRRQQVIVQNLHVEPEHVRQQDVFTGARPIERHVVRRVRVAIRPRQRHHPAHISRKHRVQLQRPRRHLGIWIRRQAAWILEPRTHHMRARLPMREPAKPPPARINRHRQTHARVCWPVGKCDFRVKAKSLSRIAERRELRCVGGSQRFDAVEPNLSRGGIKVGRQIKIIVVVSCPDQRRHRSRRWRSHRIRSRLVNMHVVRRVSPYDHVVVGRPFLRLPVTVPQRQHSPIQHASPQEIDHLRSHRCRRPIRA